MTSFRQIAANRRNARKSTGPITEEGKQRSRCNAVRHGLTAETVIGALEDAEDYKAFEAAITADYDAQSAVERELCSSEFSPVELRNRKRASKYWPILSEQGHGGPVAPGRVGKLVTCAARPIKRLSRPEFSRLDGGSQSPHGRTP